MTNHEGSEHRAQRRHWDDDDIINGMELAKKLNQGVIPPKKQLARFRQEGHHEVPTEWQIRSRGGTLKIYQELDWELDDVTKNRFQRLSESDLHDVLVEMTIYFGRLPSNNDIRQYARSHPGKPSADIFINRYGGLVNAMEQLGIFTEYYSAKLLELGESGLTNETGGPPKDYRELIRSLNFHRFANAVVYMTKKAAGVDEDNFRTWFSLRDNPVDRRGTIIQTYLHVEKQPSYLSIGRYLHQMTATMPLYQIEMPISEPPLERRIYSTPGVIRVVARDQDDKKVEYATPRSTGNYPIQILELIKIVSRDLSRATSGRSM